MSIGVIAAIAFAAFVLPALGASGPPAIRASDPALGASGPAAPALTATHVRVTTTPKRGSTTTAFVIRFRAPVATGVVQNVRREFDLNLSGPTDARPGA